MSIVLTVPLDSRSDDQPLVSVIIIAYNGDKYIEKALLSVLNQTYERLEIIVVEDGSRDLTERLCKSLGGNRVHYVWRPNGGLSAARNTGVASATGEYLAFLDCDDWWSPSKIERQVAELTRNPSCSFVYSSAARMDEHGALIETVYAKEEGYVLPRLLLSQCVAGSASSVMVRKSAFLLSGGFDESVTNAEDWDCWLRLSTTGEAAFVVDVDVFLLVRQNSHGKNTQRNFECSRAMLISTFANIAAEHAHLRGAALANVEWIASIDHATAGRRMNATRHILMAIKLSPSTIIYWKRLLLLLLRRV